MRKLCSTNALLRPHLFPHPISRRQRLLTPTAHYFCVPSHNSLPHKVIQGSLVAFSRPPSRLSPYYLRILLWTVTAHHHPRGCHAVYLDFPHQRRLRKEV